MRDVTKSMLICIARIMVRTFLYPEYEELVVDLSIDQFAVSPFKKGVKRTSRVIQCFV